MEKIIIGCAGWEYKDWKETFYPKNLPNAQHLSYYAKFFQYTEINSTFYNLPSQDIVYGWLRKVPDDFKFTVKVWKEITHNYSDPELETNIQEFFSRLEPLKEKIKNFLLQFPPWFKYNEENINTLKYILTKVPQDYIYIIELRDNSWFEEKILSQFIDNENFYLATSYLKGISPYFHQQQNIYYIRLIGDRELQRFNLIQRNQREILSSLKVKIHNFFEKKPIREIFIIVNNHFTGFAPETANQLKKMFQLTHRDFKSQKSLVDFM